MTFNSRNDIIDGALETCGVKAADESSTAADVLTAKKFLNRMVKRLQATGAHLFSENLATLFLSTGQRKYQIGGDANATEEFSETTTNVAAVAGTNKVFLTSTDGILVDDQLGVRLDDGVIRFSSVIQVATLFVTFEDDLIGEAASGNVVYFYTTRLGKALRIPDARRSLIDQEIQMIQLGRIDYLNLPNKENQGTPVQFYYDPNTQTTGDLFLWPAPASTNTIINFTYYKPLEVFTDADDTAEFPDEWIEALVLNLALRLFTVFAQPMPPGFEARANAAAADALDWDQDDASMYLTPSKVRGQ